MFTPTFQKFKDLASQGNLIPVFREHLADMETPVSALSRFAEDEHAFLLESVEGGERWGRYSFIGMHPRAVFSVTDDGAKLQYASGETVSVEHSGQGFAALREVMQDCHPVNLPELPRFAGGAVGYIGYETVNEFESLPPPKSSSDGPTTCFMIADDLAVFDNVRHTVKAVACVHIEDYDSLDSAYQDACDRIETIETRLHSPRPAAMPSNPNASVEIKSNLNREEFRGMVERARQYIIEGDIIQVVLSQRFTTERPAPPLAIYRALRLINPSPYTFFLKFGSKTLVGSSPEVMVRLTGSTAELRPIAGTRPRGATEQEDRRLADDLLKDEKERAEHVMLVDLGRNDLGRVARQGSVQVRDFMTIERYSHVMHIVSHIEAVLEKGQDAFDLVRATFPAGTLSGAPKIRAMEIINELEPQARGAYGGACGYIGYDGNMDLAITIRTVDIEESRASIQAGAGIVYDSDPDREYEETVNKARGMVRALELAAGGLELRGH